RRALARSRASSGTGPPPSAAVHREAASTAPGREAAPSCRYTRPVEHGFHSSVVGERQTDAVRQPSAYVVRATSPYGHGLTIARISACTCRSTTGFAEPPPSSPQTIVTSLPSSTSSSTTASESIERSL